MLGVQKGVCNGALTQPASRIGTLGERCRELQSFSALVLEALAAQGL